MASIFDDLATTNPNQLIGTDLSFYDADTLYDPNGQGYRLQGVNALEVDTLGKDGQVGGELTTEQAVRLANDLGYTNVIKTGEMDSTGTREMIDLQDSQGRSFRRELAASGLAKPMAGFDPSGDLSQSARFRRAMRTTNQYEDNEFDKAADILEQHMDEEGANTLRFKQKRLMPGMNADFISRGAGATFEFDGIDTETGKSTGSWGTAWSTSMNGVADAAFGIADMVGDRFGISTLEKYGEAGSERARERISREGKILLDYQDVNSFGTAVDYLTNNLVMSIPYMGITAASALAAPMTGGASLLAPVSIYTGQTWNEMGDQIKGTDKERSASIAIASGLVQGALDLVGLKLIVGTSTVPKDIFKKGVDALVSNGYSEKQAVEYLATQTKRGIAELSGDAAKVAREQLDSMRLVTTTLGRAGEGALSEGVTEAMQESIAAIAADIGSETDIDWVDVKERAIAGAVAGAALGGGLSAAGSIKDAGAWADIAYNISPLNPEDNSTAGQYASEEEASKGYVPTNQENLADIDNLPDPVEAVVDRKARHEERLKKRTVSETVADMMTNIPALWRGSVRHIFTEDLQARSRTARVMADLFNGRHTRIFGGANYENRMHHHMTASKNSVITPEKFFVNMNQGKHVFAGDEIRLSQKFYEEVKKGIDNNGRFDPKLIPESETKATTVALAQQLLTLGDKLYADQKKHNADLGYIQNYLLRYKTLNKKAVKKHRNHFISKLKEHYQLDDATAVALTDQILNGDSGTVGEAFSVVKGGPHPESHKARKFNLSEKDDFQQFMEQDVFANVSEAARTAARYVAVQEFVGDNASKIGKMLDQMQREGLSEAEVDRIASQMTNYLDAQSGNYKRPTSEFGKALQAIQKNFMLFVTITSLPLAALSSLPELAMTTRGLTYDQIFGKKGQKGSLNAMGQELANMLYKGMLEVSRLSYSVAPSLSQHIPGRYPTDDTRGTQLLRFSGHYEWDVGAAATTGVTETHAWHTKLLDKFFKWTGLAGLTNFTRATRAAIFGDFVVDNVNIIINHDPATPETNEVRIAKEKLRNLGIDVSRNLQDLIDVMNGTASDAVNAKMEEQVREGLFNFINEAVAMPQSANRPLMYQDPRLALFMQFQGFMATFTSNHLPRMWDEYIKRGSPAMKYHTFAMMTSMIMLGFASQYLKDLVKFGESSPYLDEAELIQRGILASGLMGTPERVFNQFFPLYETRTDGPVDWVFNTASGESPTIGKIATLGGAVTSGVTGDLEGAAKDTARATLGPFYQPVKWAFNGE